MLFELPPLPYAYNALEPYIDEKTMIVHYTGHHKAYVENLNKLVAENPVLKGKNLEEVIQAIPSLPKELATAVKNNAGGHFNHSFFWPLMKPNGGGKPTGKIADAITKKFGSFEKFQEEFNAVAKKVFGSGWAWLVVDPKGQLCIVSMQNQDPVQLQGYKPVMGLDVWEHAYYLKYQNKRPDYIAAWWHVVNWDQVEQNYEKALAGK